MADDAERAVVVVDVGSTLPGRKTQRSAFAWARKGIRPAEEMCSSRSPDLLLERLRQDFRLRRSVALGFEAPLYIPIPKLSSSLSRARSGEGNRAWSAPAGLSVASLAVHQAAWILRELREEFSRDFQLTVNASAWPPTAAPPSTLFLWEAFVSGPAHSSDDRRDAATAADFFVQHERELTNIHALGDVDTPLSLIGVAAIWSKWVDGADELYKPTIVLRPGAPFVGNLGAL